MSENRIPGMNRGDSRCKGSARGKLSSLAWRVGWLALAIALIGLAFAAVAADLLQVGEHVFEFRGVTYNSDGTSTWDYTVTSGRKPSLSHWVLEWDPSILGPGNVVYCSEQHEVGTDPKTHVYGLKFDGGYRDNESRDVTFTLDGWYEVTSTRVGVKAGKKTEVEGPISGPGGELEPENVPPTAVNDAASAGENDSIQVDVLANDSDEDGALNRTTVVITQTSMSGSADVDPTTGVVTYAPYPGACGDDSFDYTVEDNDGAVSNEARVAVLVVCNKAPVATDDVATTDEHTAIAVNVVANDEDFDGVLDLGSISISRDPAFGSLCVHPTAGIVTYTPVVGGCGDDSFEYTVQDDDGATSNPAAVTVSVLCTDPPLAIDDLYNVEEGGTLSVPPQGALANDQETPGKPLVAVLVSGVEHGALTLEADGSFVYVHDGSETREDAFTYRASDTSKESNVATANLVIAPANDTPAAADDEAETDEDFPVTIDVLANDSDPDEDTLAVDWASAPANGRVSNLGAAIEYAPNPDFYGTDTFTYAVSDGHGGTSRATVTVRVAAVNDDPLAQADTGSTEEDVALEVAVLSNDSDPDGDSLAIESVTQGENGSVAEGGAGVIYTPNADFYGTDAFAYTISDGAGGTSSAVVTVVVTPVNDAPQALGGAVSTDEDTALEIEVMANDSDPDGDLLTLDSVTQPSHGTVMTNGDTATYTPAANFHGEDSFTYAISDGRGGTSTATISIVVAPVNDTPLAEDDSAFTDEDVAATIAVLANDSDPDGDALTIQAAGQPAHGTVTSSGADITYLPDEGFNGVDTFEYSVSDGSGGVAGAVVTVNVAMVNEPPVAVGGHVETNEDTAITIEVLANDTDADGDILLLQSVTSPENGTLTKAGTTATYVPNAGFYGDDAFSYTVSDGRGGMASGTITITVVEVNDPPVARDDSASTNEDAAVTISVLANDSDPDGDPLAIESSSLAASGNAGVDGTTITYVPAPGFHGVDSFTYTVGDGRGGLSSASVTVHVADVNDVPLAGDDEVSTLEDIPATVFVLANDTDPDRDPLIIESSTAPLHGVAIRAGASIVYTPTSNYSGQDTFTYTVADGNGGTARATVTVTVVEANDLPVAQDDAATTSEGTAVMIGVLSNDRDTDGDLLAIQAVTQPSHGRVSNEGATLTYTPDDGFSGTDTFSYTLSDGRGGSDTAQVSVTVTHVNKAPLAQDDSATMTGGAVLTIEILQNDSDPDGDFLLVQSIGTPAHGTALNGRTSVSYIPDGGFAGVDTFSYMVADGNGGASTAFVTVSVAAANQPPVASDDSGVTDEDLPVTIAVLTNDVDPDGEDLRIESIGRPSSGSAVRDGAMIMYSPAEGWSGVDTFTYTVSDGRGGTATASVMVAVVAVNDAPTAQDDSATTDMETAVSIPVLLNDTDEESAALTITSVGQGHNGMAFNAGTEIVYTPDPGFVGTDSFTYTVTDGEGLTATAAVTVGVAGVTGAGGAAIGDALGSRVIISEVAWAGTAADAQDEWIELRNLGSESVDLAGWSLQWRRTRPVTPEDYVWKVVELSGTLAAAGDLPASPETDTGGVFVRPDDASSLWWRVSYDSDRDTRGYFLLERTRDEVVKDVPSGMLYDATRSPALALSDLGEVIVLVNARGDVVDTANATNVGRDAWAGGSQSSFGSMERVDPFGSDVAENWSTNGGVITRGEDAQRRPLRATPGTRNSPRLETLYQQAGAEPVALRAGGPLAVSFSLSRGDRKTTGWPWVVSTRPGLDLAAGAGGGLDVSTCSFSGQARPGNEYVLDIRTGGTSPGVVLFWIVYGKGEALLVPVRITP
jgi:hypothetical protein